MMLLHAFKEEDLESQDLHLRFWHGTIHPSQVDDDGDYPIVCWCGGRKVDLSKDVAAVWHLQEFYRPSILLVDFEGDDEEDS